MNEIGEAFCEGFAKNPLEISFNVTADDLKKYWNGGWDMLTSHLEDDMEGLSIVAKDRNTGKWLGACLNGDFYKETDISKLERGRIALKAKGGPFPDFIRQIVLAIIDLEEKMRKQEYLKDLKEHECFGIGMLSVSPNATGAGIGSNLLSLSLQRGKELGYISSAVIMSNNITTKLVTTKFGFKIIDDCFIDYKQFKRVKTLNDDDDDDNNYNICEEYPLANVPNIFPNETKLMCSFCNHITI